jgi:serine/threonine protein kinase
MSHTRYQILGTIGVGASSRVDKAHDTLIDRTVVLKTFATGFGSSELQKQFLREAQILGRLCHPNIISIYDLGAGDNGSVYLVTEYVPGKTLDAVLSEKGPIPLARAGVWAGDLASALSRAHKAGVIHGDVKPANIFVTDDGQIKLGDFGIARFATQVSGAASLVGTPAYLSPEQIKGDPQDHRSDIFSVGIVLYQLTTGVRPFDGSSIAAVCAQIVAKQPAPPSHHNPTLPAEFDRIVMRCLAKNPADRYASGESLAASLYPFARNKPQPRPHSLDFSWLHKPLRPADKWIYSGAVALALLAIPLAPGLYSRWRQTTISHPNPGILSATTVATAPVTPSVEGVRNTGNAATPPKTARIRIEPGGTQISTAKPAVSRAAITNSPREIAGEPETPGASGAERAVPAALPPGEKTAPPVLRSTSTGRAASPTASLSIEISSAVNGATLAIFVDQRLLATSPLSVTRTGASVHLDRPLPAGPHEFRIALYRQDKTLQIEKQGLAELQPGVPNLLAIHVIYRSRMLVKRNADLDILWPSTPNSAPDHASSRASTPLAANSVAALR